MLKIKPFQYQCSFLFQTSKVFQSYIIKIDICLSQDGTFVAVSFVLCSVLFSLKCLNFSKSVCPIVLTQ